MSVITTRVIFLLVIFLTNFAYCQGPYAAGMGSSRQGQLGIGNTKQIYIPVPAESFNSLDVYAIEPGSQWTLILTTQNLVYVIGLDAFGQLGMGSLNSIYINPTLNPFMMNTIGICTGGSMSGNEGYSYFYNSTQLYATGSNTYGQLGVGDKWSEVISQCCM